MTTKSPSLIKAETSTYIAPNGVGAVTAAQVRDRMLDIADSFVPLGSAVGEVHVWQLWRALDAAGHYYTVEDAIAPALPSNVVYLAWRSGAPRTRAESGDGLYDAIVGAIGSVAADAAYAAAASVAL